MEKEILNIYNTIVSKHKFDDEIKNKVYKSKYYYRCNKH